MSTSKRKRTLQLFLSGLLLSGLLVVQSGFGQEVEWTRQFGTASFDLADALAADASGIYVAGSTSGALGGETLVGRSDAYVRKYDAEGNVLWTRQFGTASFDSASALAADASGIYVAGKTPVWLALPCAFLIAGVTIYGRMTTIQSR